MTVKIIVPELGESVLEATVSNWLKKEGDYVNVGDVLVELETDKVNLEVGAKSAGVLQKIQAPNGSDVKVGDVLGMIEEKEGQPKESAPVTSAPVEPKQEPAAENVRASEKLSARQISPVASRLASEKNVDLSKVSGSGNDGRITKADVESYLQGAAKAEAASQPEVRFEAQASAVSSSARSEERVRMSRRRQTIAKRLLEAKQNTAMLTTFNEIDMSATMDLRKRRNDDFQKRHGIKLGFMSLFTKAAISALKAYPAINAEIDGDEIVYKNYYDIGMAIGSEEGLVVPVIRDADKLSFAEIEKSIKAFSEKTQQGKLSVEDLRGGTFTITNGGVFGSLLSTPILNPPQVGILGLHKIEERPMAVNGQVVIRPMMYVALSYDHRIVDGREAVQFLVHIKQLLEDPAWMLVEG
ncbi:MAG: 2-oxoglutarate dehydrogenase complex dihydrolipoyllysine-residue succinyltransferase [Anaerolineales bacterium]|nr:2-oxoglutarate dehydrogenase complex dihydrolipoyllysine-residue succinyltransferase [Anaerolineales bacterium]